MKRKLIAGIMGGLMAVAANGWTQGIDVQGQKAEKAGVAKPATKPGVTAEQRAMLNEKLALVDRILRTMGADRVGPTLSAEKQRWAMESLFQMPLAQLRSMEAVGSIDTLPTAMAKAKKVAPKLEGPALGQQNTELVYYPLTPCRFADTRVVGGPLGGTPRGFDLDDNGSVYGGIAACDPSATVGNDANQIGAVAINLTIIGPTVAPGFLGARPAGGATTTSLVNWYQTGSAVQAANAGIVTTDQTFATDEIEVFGSPTNFIIDFFGLFAAPTRTALNCVNVFNASSSTVAPDSFVQLTDAEIQACPAGYTAMGFIWDFVSGSGGLAPWENAPENAQTGGISLGFTHTRPSAGSAGSTITFTPGRRCCQIPGR